MNQLESSMLGGCPHLDGRIIKQFHCVCYLENLINLNPYESHMYVHIFKNADVRRFFFPLEFSGVFSTHITEYSPFHNYLPFSSVHIHQKTVRNYETGCCTITVALIILIGLCLENIGNQGVSRSRLHTALAPNL